jgi:hypothetical protein
MKKMLLFTILLFPFLSQSQTIEDVWVYFRDKPQKAQYLSHPLRMLSQRALDRRAGYNIDLDEKDVPIDNNYFAQISQANGIVIKAKSKWLNALHVQGYEADIRALLSFNFVEHIEFANKSLGNISRHTTANTVADNFCDLNRTPTTYNYGDGENQIYMLHGESLHLQNFQGTGVLIAIIDAGFQQVDTDPLFAHLRDNHKIVDVYNFVGNDNNVYQYHMHGSGVLSTIAAKTNGVLVGTAPDALFALYVSEDVSQEMPIEESYWAQAAERADSIGVDVINTSLGYKTFNRSEYNYTMDDLDGKTAFISRAAEIAVSRGMNVVVSAGNSGGSSWPKIGFPADAKSVITVGAVDENELIANFSSRGNTVDNHIKPDVMAQGQNSAVFWNGSIRNLNGTSFSSPIMAGMIACLVQAAPYVDPYQIKQSVIETGDNYNTPNSDYGYGIPDFSKNKFLDVDNIHQNIRLVYPNPTTKFISINDLIRLTDYTIIDMYGKIVLQGNTAGKISLAQLRSGIYLLQIEDKLFKIIKYE